MSSKERVSLIFSMPLSGKVDMSTEPKKHDVVVTRVFDAPVEQVWKAWSHPDDVKQWWGPTGFTCILAKMDFREGGTSLVGMRAPKEFGGQDSSVPEDLLVASFDKRQKTFYGVDNHSREGGL